MDLSQLGLGDTSGTSTSAVSIPGLSGILTVITIASIVITVLIAVLYIVNIVRRWKVDKAIIETHKEVVAIRILLEGKQTQPAPVVPVVTVQPEVTPPTPIVE